MSCSGWLKRNYDGTVESRPGVYKHSRVLQFVSTPALEPAQEYQQYLASELYEVV